MRVVFLVAVSALVLPIAVQADDEAASIAAGGLVPRREIRIVMAKEVLRISLKKIVVDYDFRNDTDQDVTTEVAFPVPPYDHSENSYIVSMASFSDFMLSIDGKPAPFKAEAKATLKGKEVTEILEADKIDIASFGHLQEHEGLDTRNKIPDFTRLPEKEQKRLIAMGFFDIDKNNAEANWTVHLQYHWKQSFPAHSTVHIRHEYTPVAGSAGMIMDEKSILDAGKIPVNETKPRPLNPNDPSDITTYCLGLPLAKSLAANIHQSVLNGLDISHGDYTILLNYVDFILTTANSWRKPIEDFTLIIERPKPESGGHVLVSFCSPMNGKVEKLDADYFQVHLTNFVPAAELHIGFFEVPVIKPDLAAAKKSAPGSFAVKKSALGSFRWMRLLIAALVGVGFLFSLATFFLRYRKKNQATTSQM